MLRQAKAFIRPLVPKPARRWVAERRFFTPEGLSRPFFGKFNSFQEARDFEESHQIPDLPSRYVMDHGKWAQWQSQLRLHDYPVLFWLATLMGEGNILFDLGGSVGVCYYLYRQWLTMPKDLRWIVSEMPEPVELGRKLAAERDATQLSFTTDHQGLDGSNILLAAGVLQYIEQPLPELLGGLKTPPKHILINRLALTEQQPGFITLEHHGQSITPVRVENHDAFIAAMDQAGYRLVDEWKCLQNSMSIPTHPECTLEHFHGMYFKAA